MALDAGGCPLLHLPPVLCRRLLRYGLHDRVGGKVCVIREHFSASPHGLQLSFQWIGLNRPPQIQQRLHRTNAIPYSTRHLPHSLLYMPGVHAPNGQLVIFRDQPFDEKLQSALESLDNILVFYRPRCHCLLMTVGGWWGGRCWNWRCEYRLRMPFFRFCLLRSLF